MFPKNIWIPILILIVFLTSIVGLLYKQKGTDHTVRKVFKPATVYPSTQPKPPPPGETADSGHWHGDEWHAEPHDAHTPATPNPTPPSALTSQTQDTPHPLDFSAAYQALREKYPEQTQNPPPFEKVPVNLWDFEATKKAFMDHFNFYVAQGGNKPEVFNNNREVRIASAVMENIYNASKPWVGLFTPEQREEIKEMHRRLRRVDGVKVNHDRVWELVHDEGYSVLEALRISREESSN